MSSARAVVDFSLDDLRSDDVRFLQEAARIGPLHVRIPDDATLERRAEQAGAGLAARAAFDVMADEIGAPDVVVSNAGVATSMKALDLTASDWDRVVDTNLKGCWLVCNEAARRLSAASKAGSFIMISSILGRRVAGNVAPYAAAKAGVEHLTRALALEWARHGIRVNALAPGYIETDLNREFFASEPGQKMIRRIPQRRLGQAGDLDGPLLLLASDYSNYMTGSTLVVDGGHLQSSL